VIISTLPVVPPATIAVMEVAETTVKEDAGIPPNFTPVAPVNPVPVMVMVEPLPAF
jgi:hypothetical protein